MKNYRNKRFSIILQGSATVLLLTVAGRGAVVSGATAGGYAYYYHPDVTVSYWYQNSSYKDMGTTSVGNSNAVSTVAVSASLGEIHLYNETSFTYSWYGTVRTELGGGFQDNLTVSSAERNGESGTYKGSLRVNLDQSLVGSFQRDYFCVFVNQSMDSARGGYTGGPVIAGVGFDTGGQVDYNNYILNFEMPFTFGQEFSIGVWMVSVINTWNSSSPGYLSAIHDASHTVNWAGTVGVEDSLGNDIAPEDFSLTSSSGTNYLTPIGIPEPSMVSLLVLGIFAVGQKRAHRR